MPAVTLSYSQALRVIGQNLILLQIDSFELVKWGDDYIVWTRDAESSGDLPVKNSFLNRTIKKILGDADLARKTPHRVYFSNLEILTLDIERQAQRKANSPTDVRDMSFVLRVLGNFLDRKAAREFTISCAGPNTIQVRYDNKEESFTLQNLYDFGINMYLKRSTRQSTN